MAGAAYAATVAGRSLGALAAAAASLSAFDSRSSSMSQSSSPTIISSWPSSGSAGSNSSNNSSSNSNSSKSSSKNSKNNSSSSSSRVTRVPIISPKAGGESPNLLAAIAGRRWGRPPATAATFCETGAVGGRSSPTMPRLTTFGEAMIRYVPDPDTSRELPGRFATRWLQSGGGAELNLTIALCNLGWGDKSRWISVVPSTQMGDIILQLASGAYSTGGRENLSLVRRAEGELGIYHAWPLEGKVCFQRRNSTFGQMDPDWFDDSFWRRVLLEESKNDEAPHIFHLTGITPLIGPKSYKAWWRALRVAREIKKHQDPNAKNRLVVTLDMNHRPALGTFEDLWVLIEPHLATTDLFVVSIGDIVKLGALLDVPEAANMFLNAKIEPSAAGTKDLEMAVARGLKALQAKLGHKTNLAVCCKHRTPELRTPGGPPVQIRWSMTCLKSGTVVSTHDTAITQEVLEEIGGGDSWLSGTLDGLFGGGARVGDGVAGTGFSEAAMKAAMRRGDVMATLKQRQVGDFSHVMRETLDAEHQELLKKHGLLEK